MDSNNNNRHTLKIEEKEKIKQERLEERHSKKAFTYLVRMAKRKDALVEVEINGKIILKSKT